MGRPSTQPILRSVNRLVAEIPPDLITSAVEVQVELARNLARQMDAVAPGTSGAVAQALPAITRELQATLERIILVNPARDPFLEYLFADEHGIDVRIRTKASRVAAGIEDD